MYGPLFFATEKCKDPDLENSDAQFWVYMVPSGQIRSHDTFPVKDSFYEQDPYSLEEGAMINVSVFLDDLNARAYETRMYHQKGRFFIAAQKDNDIPMNKQPEVFPFLYRFVIPAKHKPTIREELHRRGVNRAYLYGTENPDHQALMDAINKKIFQ